MKIHAAFSDPSEIPYLIEHGADELYCGLLTDIQIEGMTNHRHNKRSMNIADMNMLKEAIDIAGEHKVNVVVNEVGYADRFLKQITEKMIKMDKMGVNAFIVSDIGLMSVLKGLNIRAKIYLSSVAPVFNVEAFNLYKKFNIKRMVLPQHLYPKEFAEIKDKIDVEIEFFFLETDYCRLIDGHCFYTYNSQIWKDIIPLDACEHITSIMKNDGGGWKKSFSSLLHYHFPVAQHTYGAVYDYFRLGADVLKLGNREVPFNVKKKVIRLAKYMTNLLEKNITRKRFIRLSKIKAASLLY